MNNSLAALSLAYSVGSRIGPVLRSSAPSFDGWSIAEFARAIHGPNSKHKAIAVLVGYFDESGIGARDKLTTVSGIVADSVIWGRLERPWRKGLGPSGPTPGVKWFHSVACEHGEGQFARIDEPFRSALVYRLSTELGKLPGQGFASGVVRDDWQFAPDALKRRNLNDPYFFALELCLQQISSYSKSHCDGEPIALVFAKQQQYQAGANRLHDFYQSASHLHGFSGIGSISWSEPRLIVPLQAADMLAYEVYRYWLSQRGLDAAPMRPALKNIEREGQLSISFTLHDKDTLPDLLPRQL